MSRGVAGTRDGGEGGSGGQWRGSAHLGDRPLNVHPSLLANLGVSEGATVSLPVSLEATLPPLGLAGALLQGLLEAPD